MKIHAYKEHVHHNKHQPQLCITGLCGTSIMLHGVAGEDVVKSISLHRYSMFTDKADEVTCYRCKNVKSFILLKAAQLQI